MHDVLFVSVPLMTILAGLFFNRSETQNLRGEMQGLRSEFKADIRELRSEMNARFDRVDAELRYFHGVTGKLDGRIEAVEKRQLSAKRQALRWPLPLP